MVQGTTCSATRRDGSRCTATILLDSSRCFAHDPDRQAAMRAARAAGGRGKALSARLDKLVPASLKPVIGLLFTALEEVHTGTLTPSQAQAMAAVAGAIGRLYQTGVLEERLSALETAYGQEEQRGRRATW